MTSSLGLGPLRPRKTASSSTRLLSTRRKPIKRRDPR